MFPGGHTFKVPTGNLILLVGRPIVYLRSRQSRRCDGSIHLARSSHKTFVCDYEDKTLHLEHGLFAQQRSGILSSQKVRFYSGILLGWLRLWPLMDNQAQFWLCLAYFQSNTDMSSSVRENTSLPPLCNLWFKGSFWNSDNFHLN